MKKIVLIVALAAVLVFLLNIFFWALGKVVDIALVIIVVGAALYYISNHKSSNNEQL